MKCGFICKKCRRVNIDKTKVEATMCPHSWGLHSIVKSAIMCQNCDCLGDDFTEFMSTPCDGKLFEGDGPTLNMPKSFQAEVEAPGAAPAALPQAESIDGPEEKLSMELKDAHVRMTQLLLLQSLRDEREKLSKLQVLKSGRSVLSFYVSHSR